MTFISFNLVVFYLKIVKRPWIPLGLAAFSTTGLQGQKAILTFWGIWLLAFLRHLRYSYLHYSLSGQIWLFYKLLLYHTHLLALMWSKPFVQSLREPGPIQFLWVTCRFLSIIGGFFIDHGRKFPFSERQHTTSFAFTVFYLWVDKQFLIRYKSLCFPKLWFRNWRPLNHILASHWLILYWPRC